LLLVRKDLKGFLVKLALKVRQVQMVPMALLDQQDRMVPLDQQDLPGQQVLQVPQFLTMVMAAMEI
jgi:hypothetical protein